MYKKLLVFIFFVLSFQITSGQNEFITIWKPNAPVLNPPIAFTAPYPAGDNQIWFPGIGENYTISWEEVGYPQHNGTIPNVTSTNQVFIDFGTSLNPTLVDATYKVKVSNGNGVFKQIRFGDPVIYNFPTLSHMFILWNTLGSIDKITEITQWGDISWTSMNNAFSNCRRLQLTATDTPNLSNVTDASFMFFGNPDFKGHNSMSTWNTSTIKLFTNMLGYFLSASASTGDTFNLPLGSWDMSSAEDISYMFFYRKAFNQNINSWNISNVTTIEHTFENCISFNQPLNNWNTSKVTTMAHTFENCFSFNQPLDNWNTSKVTNMTFLFHFIPVFNQPLASWDTSNVTDFSHIFHNCTAFNQPLNTWNTSKGTTMEMLFTGASSFNQPLDSWDTSSVTSMLFTFLDATNFDQSLQTWDLSSLTSANQMIQNSGLKCENYSKTLSGWANNPNTPNNINLVSTAPLIYSPDVINDRNILINKGWIFNGDTLGGECRILGVSENQVNSISIYPNPATDFIYIKNLKGLASYKIFDQSGRIVLQNLLNEEKINVNSLSKGNYILQIISKDKTQSLKFIKN